MYTCYRCWKHRLLARIDRDVSICLQILAKGWAVIEHGVTSASVCMKNFSTPGTLFCGVSHSIQLLRFTPIKYIQCGRHGAKAKRGWRSSCHVKCWKGRFRHVAGGAEEGGRRLQTLGDSIHPFIRQAWHALLSCYNTSKLEEERHVGLRLEGQ